MFNFFNAEKVPEKDVYLIKDKDFNHIKNVLRMKIGEQILVSNNNCSDLCEITEFTNEMVIASIIEKNYADTSLPIELHLFQGLPKSDKMEFIIQKTVELGVTSITPIQMQRSIVKLDQKSSVSKIARWQSISESAAKQSKLSFIPKVNDLSNFKLAIEDAKKFDHIIIPYECKNGMQDTKSALSKIKSGDKIAVFIGPEGGFDQSEIEQALLNGAVTVSLGKRILRTETAAITAISMFMLYAEMNL